MAWNSIFNCSVSSSLISGSGLLLFWKIGFHIACVCYDVNQLLLRLWRFTFCFQEYWVSILWSRGNKFLVFWSFFLSWKASVFPIIGNNQIGLSCWNDWGKFWSWLRIGCCNCFWFCTDNAIEHVSIIEMTFLKCCC